MGESENYTHHFENDVLEVLRESELNIPKFEGSSEQLCFRRILVDWLAVISERLRLSNGILHLAVTYVDLVMDRWTFSTEAQLNLLALCCLWVAAKLDENDDLIPPLARLKSFLEKSFEQEDFMQMELNIMQSLDWRLVKPTSVQFLDIFMKVTPEDFHCDYKVTNTAKYKTYIRKYSYYFLDVSLQDHIFNNFLRSHIAAAALYAARTCLKLAPTWSETLHTKTGYTEQQLSYCVSLLLKIHDDDQARSAC